jgi:hypothetical protein
LFNFCVIQHVLIFVPELELILFPLLSYYTICGIQSHTKICHFFEHDSSC